VAIAVQIREPLAEEAKKRVGGRPRKGVEKPPPNSGGDLGGKKNGEPAVQAALRMDVGKTAVEEIITEAKEDPEVVDELIKRETTVKEVRKKFPGIFWAVLHHCTASMAACETAILPCSTASMSSGVPSSRTCRARWTLRLPTLKRSAASVCEGAPIGAC